MDLDEAIQRSRGERLAHPRVFNFDPQSQMSDEKNIYEYKNRKTLKHTP